MEGLLLNASSPSQIFSHSAPANKPIQWFIGHIHDCQGQILKKCALRVGIDTWWQAEATRLAEHCRSGKQPSHEGNEPWNSRIAKDLIDACAK
jgi:hypothetical protein